MERKYKLHIGIESLEKIRADGFSWAMLCTENGREALQVEIG